jgi:hypothetical protein
MQNAPADLEAVRRTLREAPNTIISSETFGGLAPARIVDLFPPGETIIVVYVREQLDFAVSSYAQAIQGGVLHTKTFEDFARGWKRRNYADYGAFLDRWSKAFGPEHVRVRLYDRKHLTEGDIAKDFLTVLGIDWRATTSSIRASIRTSPSPTW